MDRCPRSAKKTAATRVASESFFTMESSKQCMGLVTINPDMYSCAYERDKIPCYWVHWGGDEGGSGVFVRRDCVESGFFFLMNGSLKMGCRGSSTLEKGAYGSKPVSADNSFPVMSTVTLRYCFIKFRLSS